MSMSESGPNPLRSAAKIVSVNVVLLLIGLVGLELLFGNWFQPNRMSRLNLIRDAWLQYKVGSLYPTESQTITYVRDRHGLRGERSADGHVDILTIGGSATDQRYITEGQTWQDVLRSEFLKNGTDLSIVNAGVDGHQIDNTQANGGTGDGGGGGKGGLCAGASCLMSSLAGRDPIV